MPKISVIVPVYGVEKYIERCATSLFCQTLDNIEFIFIDDCSPDRSMELLLAKIDEYRPRFIGMSWTARIEKMPTNSGQAAVRRHGIHLATGDYVIHCDSDDWVDSNLYEEMYKATENGNYDIVISNYKMTDGYHEKLCNAIGIKDSKAYLKSMFNSCYTWFLSNKLFKSSLWDDQIVWPNGNMGEDMCLTLQLFYNAKRINFVVGPVYNYFTNPNSIARAHSEEKDIDKFKQLSDNIRVVEEFYVGKKIDEDIAAGLKYLGFYKYEMLAKVKKTEYAKIYKNGVKEKAWEVIRNNRLPIKERVKALFMWVGFFPYI